MDRSNAVWKRSPIKRLQFRKRIGGSLLYTSTQNFLVDSWRRAEGKDIKTWQLVRSLIGHIVLMGVNAAQINTKINNSVFTKSGVLSSECLFCWWSISMLQATWRWQFTVTSYGFLKYSGWSVVLMIQRFPVQTQAAAPLGIRGIGRLITVSKHVHFNSVSINVGNKWTPAF